LILIPKFLEDNGKQVQVIMAIEEMADVLFCMNTLMTIYKTNENELFTLLHKKLKDRNQI